LVAQRAGTLHATHELELEGDCARCGTAGRYQDAISHARPARTTAANRHLHGLLHRTWGTPPAGGAPTAALRFDSGESGRYIAVRYAYSSAFHRALPAVPRRPAPTGFTAGGWLHRKTWNSGSGPVFGIVLVSLIGTLQRGHQPGPFRVGNQMVLAALSYRWYSRLILS